MRLVRYAIRSNFKLPETAEREVLGDTILNISETLVKKLHLPILVNGCYDKENQLSLRQWVQVANLTDAMGNRRPIEDRSLAMATQSPTFIVMLANMIAEYAAHDWYSRASLRSQRILANYLQISLSDAVNLTHQVAASMSRTHPVPGIMLPAAKLFIGPRKRTKAKQTAEPTTPESPVPHTEVPVPNPFVEQETSAEPASEPNTAVFDELVRIMSQQSDAFADLHELMNAATQGLAYGINLKRAMVCLINRNESRLKTYFHVGSEKGSKFSSFKTNLIPGTIFSKLVERPASIWVKPHSDNKIIKLIPMNFKQVIEVEEYFLISVFLNNKPVAIFYADNYHDKPMSETQYKQFKVLCAAASKALKHQASNKAKNTPS